MDFAEKYLKKYGWEEGKGLGKNEQGINKRIRLQTQRDGIGLGYDRTKGLNTEIWFSQIDKHIIEAQKRKKHRSDNTDDCTNQNETFVNSVSFNGKFVRSQDADVNSPDDCQLVEKEKTKERKKKRKTSQIEEVEEEVKEDDCSEGKSKKSIDLDKLYKKTKGATCHRTAHVGLKLSGKLQRLQEQEANFSA